MNDGDLAVLLAALGFAAEKHRHQRRKDEQASPYINHPIAVAETLVKIGGITDTATIVAAILHDTIEDTETTEQELVGRFGVRVATIVGEVSDDQNLSYDERKRRQVDHAGELSEAARLVKLGDKICNVSDITLTPPATWSGARKTEYVRWAREVVAQIRGTNAALESHFDSIAERAQCQSKK